MLIITLLILPKSENNWSAQCVMNGSSRGIYTHNRINGIHSAKRKDKFHAIYMVLQGIILRAVRRTNTGWSYSGMLYKERTKDCLLKLNSEIFTPGEQRFPESEGEVWRNFAGGILGLHCWMWYVTVGLLKYLDINTPVDYCTTSK